nr:hypothetical protein [Tanacetum cinerariifolium]
MADLAFAPQHNMIDYLEKTKCNAKFHQIVDFLTSSSINHSLTVSPTIYASNIEQFWNSATSQTINDEKQIHAIVDGKTVVIIESSVRKDLLFTDANGITCLTNEQIFKNLLLMGGGDSLVRAVTTASLDAQHDSSTITKTQSKATLNEPTPQGEGSGSSHGRQETIRGAMAQIRSEGALIQSIDPPLSKGYTVRSGEDRMEHHIELKNHVPQTPHDLPLLGGSSKRHGLGRRKVSKQGRKNLKSHQMFQDIDDVLDKDADTEMIVKDKGNGEKEMKNQKAKEKGIAFKDADDFARPIRSITSLQPLLTIDPKDKGKGILHESEHVKKSKKMDQDQIKRDAKVALKIQEDLNEEARTKRERQEEASKAALAEMYDEVQAQIDDDHELAVKLTLEEQEKYTVKERSKLLEEFFKRRKKQLAKERAEAIRRKPPIKTQLRNLMMTYLKHTGSKDDEKRIKSRKKRAACSSSKHKSPKKQKVERFMNYLEEQTDEEAMINSIKNGDQPLPRVTQVSIFGTSSTEQPPLKDKSMCNKTAKDLWDALARHMLGYEYGEQDRKAAVLYEYETFKSTEVELLLDTYIRYLQVINDLKKCGYSKDNYVNDAMGSKKKIVVVTSDLLALIAKKMKKITALLAKAFNRRKFYFKPTNNNLTTSSTSQSANKKQEFVKSDDKQVVKKADEKKRDVSRVKCYNRKKEGHFAKDCKKAKVKDYECYKTKMLLVKKDKDEEVLLAEDQAWMESSSDSDQEINANMFFMAKIKKVLSDSEAISSSADEKVSEVSYYLSKSKSESEFETSKYYDNSTNYALFVNNDDDQEIFHDATESASENFIENYIESQKDYNKSDDVQDKYDALKNQTTTFEIKNKELNKQLKELIEKNNDLLAQTKVLKEQIQVKHVVIDTHAECQEKYAKLEAERYEYMIRYFVYFDNEKQHRKQIADQEVLYDKISVKLVELDKHVRDLKNTVLEKDYKISEFEKSVRNKDLEIEKCLEHLNVCENKLHKLGQTNQTVHMIMPSKDNLYNGRKGIGLKNPSYFEKAKDLRPTLYNEKVIGLGYTLIFLTHSDVALEVEKFKRSRENKIEFAYDYGNLNASYVHEKINFEDDYFQDIINLDFEKIDSPFQQTSSIKPYVPNVILEKIIIDLEDEVVSLLEKEKANMETIESLKSKSFESSEKVSSESKNQSENDCLVVEKEYDKEENPKLKRKRRKRKSSKQNVKQVNNDESYANSDFVHFLDLDTFNSVRRPKNSSVVWKKKWSSNTSNVDLSTVSHYNLNKNVKRYSRKDLLACNYSHLEETSSAYVCNDAMNVFCNPRLCDVPDDNNFFIFDDENVRISPVSKMRFRKKPCDSLNVRSKRNLNKSLP